MIPTTLYVLTPSGPFKSSDGGKNWTLKTKGLSVVDSRWLAFDPTNNSILYLATWGGGIQKSIDGGENWFSLNDDIILSGYGFARYAASFAVDPANSNHLNLGTMTGFYSSTNGGSVWAQLNTGLLKDVVPISALEVLRQTFDQSVPADSTRGIYEFTGELLGSPPNVDGDNKIYILVLDVQDDYGTQVGGKRFLTGYFSAVNETAGVNSNLREILYLDEYPQDVTSSTASASLSNFFSKMTLYNLDPREKRWVNEGIAAYTDFQTGYPSEYEKLAFPPGNDITYWGDGTEAADRTISFLLFEYLSEHYGGQTTIKKIAQDTATSMLGINSVLASQGKTIAEILPDFFLACYLDDPDDYGGVYGFQSIDVSCATGFAFNKPNLPPYFSNTPIWSGRLFIIGTDANFYPIGDSLVFNGDNTNSFAVRVLKMPNQWSEPLDTTGAIVISPMALSDKKRGSVSSDSLSSGGPYRSMVVAVLCIDSVGTSPAPFVISNDYLSPPYVRMGVFQNVSQDRFLDIYAYSSENLYVNVGEETPDLKVALAETTTSASMEVFSRPGTDSIATIYHTDFELSSSGLAILTITGEDAAGNSIVPQADSLTVLRIIAGSGGTLASPDGKLSLFIPSRALPRDLYLTVSVVADPLLPGEGRRVIGRTYQIGPNDCSLQQPASLIMAVPAGVEGKKLGIYRLEGDQWTYVVGVFEPSSNQLLSNVYCLGTYQVQLGPHGTPANDLPSVYALHPIFPNPVLGKAVICYDLPCQSYVRLKIYNLLGQNIATLREGEEEAGYKKVIWEGKESSGKLVAQGIYFYELEAGGFRKVRKMVLFR